MRCSQHVERQRAEPGAGGFTQPDGSGDCEGSQGRKESKRSASLCRGIDGLHAGSREMKEEAYRDGEDEQAEGSGPSRRGGRPAKKLTTGHARTGLIGWRRGASQRRNQSAGRAILTHSPFHPFI